MLDLLLIKLVFQRNFKFYIRKEMVKQNAKDFIFDEKKLLLKIGINKIIYLVNLSADNCFENQYGVNGQFSIFGSICLFQ